MKSVLVVAGKLKRAEPGLPEDSLLMRALRDFNTPKIVHSDEVRTNGRSMCQVSPIEPSGFPLDKSCKWLPCACWMIEKKQDSCPRRSDCAGVSSTPMPTHSWHWVRPASFSTLHIRPCSSVSSTTYFHPSIRRDWSTTASTLACERCART